MEQNAEAEVEFSLDLIGHWPEPMLLMHDGRFIEANPAAVRLLGYPDRSVLLDRSPDQLSPPLQPDGESSANKARRFFGRARRGTAQRFEWMYLSARGEPVEVDVALSPIGHGSRDIVLCAWHDIGRLKRAQEELARRNQELQHFAQVAAHDLQTPLRTISVFTQLLQRETLNQLSEQAKQWSALVVDGSRRMQALVDDLLACARLDGPGASFGPVDCREIFEEAKSNLSAQIRDTAAEIRCGELPRIVGDGTQLIQVFQNLMENGIKYNRSAPPAVSVSARRDGDEWIFTVADNGIGIAPAHRSEVFEMFRRLHTQAEYQGTGIGLAICRRIIDRHGGRIWVESGTGGGSVFLFTLPAGGQSPRRPAFSKIQ